MVVLEVLDIDSLLIHIRFTTHGASPTNAATAPPVVHVHRSRPGVGGEPSTVLVRPDNAGANYVDDKIELFIIAFRALPGLGAGCGNVGRQLLVRIDSAGETKRFAAHLHRPGFADSLGIRVDEKIGTQASNLPDTVKYGV